VLFDIIFELLEVPAWASPLTRDIQLERSIVWTPLETVMRISSAMPIKHHDKSTGSISDWLCGRKQPCHFTICDDGPALPCKADILHGIFVYSNGDRSNERSVRDWLCLSAVV